jgi:hypothetical protein
MSEYVIYSILYYIVIKYEIRVTTSDLGPSPLTFMSQRNSSTKSNDMDEQKVDALHQYQDTDGHFSLVRRAALNSVSKYR